MGTPHSHPQQLSNTSPILQQHFFPKEGCYHLKPCLAAIPGEHNFVCSSCLGISWCTTTHPWERDLLSAGSGQSLTKPAVLLCLQSCLVPASLTPGCLTKIAAIERGLLTFSLPFLFLFFFLCSNFPRPPQKTLRHIILQMWHRSLGYKIYPAWQLAVLCNLHQLTETTVRYY